VIAARRGESLKGVSVMRRRDAWKLPELADVLGRSRRESDKLSSRHYLLDPRPDGTDDSYVRLGLLQPRLDGGDVGHERQPLVNIQHKFMRVFGLTKMTLMLAFTVVGYNLQCIRSFLAKHVVEKTASAVKRRKKRRKGTWTQLLDSDQPGSTSQVPAARHLRPDLRSPDGSPNSAQGRRPDVPVTP
jgi:hypothetical protein